jgi:hypothetical protein
MQEQLISVFVILIYVLYKLQSYFKMNFYSTVKIL